MIEKFKRTLRDSGRSVTKSRQLLFLYLQAKGPVTIKKFLDENLAVADRASLYRTLLLFKEIGVIEERIAAGRRVVELTDTYDSHHHHLTCRRCGMSAEITVPEIERALEMACKQAGFQVERHIIEVDGLCAPCQATSAAAGSAV